MAIPPSSSQSTLLIITTQSRYFWLEKILTFLRLFYVSLLYNIEAEYKIFGRSKVPPRLAAPEQIKTDRAEIFYHPKIEWGKFIKPDAEYL